MPTVRPARGSAAPPGMDGRSFFPLLRGETRTARDRLLMQFHETSAKRAYPMRALQLGRLHYIWNPWSDGVTMYRNEAQSGLTMAAMREAARTDERVAERVDLFLYRKPEELYDIVDDPACLEALIARPGTGLLAMRRELLAALVETRDPLAEAYRRFLGA